MSSLPYEEPSIVTILTLSSFVILLNVVNSILDRLLYCGLLGQILLGIAYGIPGGNILNVEVQHVVVQLGYIGLILLVYQGGLSIPIASLKANIVLSVCVALTGVSIPIALAFVLQSLMNASSLQAFAAGAALCSTSLGTTFTVLSTSGLANTRLGTVLSTAAMIDDVIGLVAVQVISNLGSGTDFITPGVVLRPLLVSLAFALFVPLTCRYIIHNIRDATLQKNLTTSLRPVFARQHARLLLHTLLLFGLVAAGSYAGTSNLFTAYLTGAIISWWDGERDMVASCGASTECAETTTTGTPTARVAGKPEVAGRSKDTSDNTEQTQEALSPPTEQSLEEITGVSVYADSFAAPAHRILKPFFFASIGFSIPIASLFEGRLVWRGVIFTLLMIIGKLACGLWLIRFPWMTPVRTGCAAGWMRFQALVISLISKRLTQDRATQRHRQQTSVQPETISSHDENMTNDTKQQDISSPKDQTSAPLQTNPAVSAKAPISLYPATMLGSAMVARGEIGFLISSTAEGNGIWSQRSGGKAGGVSDIFIVVTWAIFLCTFAGPVAVGLIARRVKALEQARASGARDVLGSWGVATR